MSFISLTIFHSFTRATKIDLANSHRTLSCSVANYIHYICQNLFQVSVNFVKLLGLPSVALHKIANFFIKVPKLATLILLAAAAVLMVETDATSGRRGVLIKVATIDVWSSSISRSQRCSNESQSSWKILNYVHKFLLQKL